MTEQIPQQKIPTAEEIKEATALVASDEVLRDDEYVKEILEEGGKLPNGSYVEDIGNFLSDRRAALLSLAERGEGTIQASMVTHSGDRMSNEQHQ